MSRNSWPVYCALYALSVLIWIADYSSKVWATDLYGGVKTLIPSFLTVRVVFNRGGLFGMVSPDVASSVPGLFFIGLMFVALLVLIWRTPSQKRMRHLGFACMMGGAAGNLYDRLFRGAVVDFIHIWRFPIFNLADAALLLGMLLITLDVVKENKQPVATG